MMDNVSIIILFVLSGLNETKSHRVAVFSLTLLCYCFIVLVNVSLIVTIILDKNLHEFYCFYPKFLWDLLSPLVEIGGYCGCLVQALVMNSYACNELSILAVMAYDRYVAICRPLVYHSILSKQRLLKLVLKLCSPFIARVFCMNWIIVKLACFPADTIVSNIAAYITIIMYVFHGIFMVWSYMYIIKTCVNSIENRAKFMKTCVPHLTSLLTFLVAILFDLMHIRYGSNDLPQTLQNFNAVEFFIIPPIMNPLIYGFKLIKIQNRILGFVYIKNK
uniref:G-protein coupled receptors family 1 profile domain-containing protein n=1 Tax=Sander lucioperca TaxID=283035 RepID=A0A8D0AD33_SANLU